MQTGLSQDQGPDLCSSLFATVQNTDRSVSRLERVNTLSGPFLQTVWILNEFLNMGTYQERDWLTRALVHMNSRRKLLYLQAQVYLLVNSMRYCFTCFELEILHECSF